MENKKKSKLWSFSFTILVIINSVNAIVSYMINPVFPDFLVSNGVTFELTGIISSLLSWIALLLRPFAGYYSDRMNKKHLMIISYVGTAICVYGYSLCHSFGSALIVRILNGVFFGHSGTVSMAFAASFVPVERMAEGVGYIGLASLIGNLCGPRLGNVIGDVFGINILFILATVVSLLCSLIIIMVPYKHIQQKTARSINLSGLFAKELTVYMLIIGLFSFGNGIISYYLRNMGNTRGIKNISLFFTVYSICMLFIKPYAGKLHDKKNVSFILFPAFILYTVGIIILANSYSLLPVLIAAVFKAIGQGSGSPAIQAEGIKILGKERSGVASSTIMIGQDIGNGLGPIYASKVINNIGYTNMFYVYAVMLITGFVGYYIFIQKKRGDKNGKRRIDNSFNGFEYGRQNLSDYSGK